MECKEFVTIKPLQDLNLNDELIDSKSFRVLSEKSLISVPLWDGI